MDQTRLQHQSAGKKKREPSVFMSAPVWCYSVLYQNEHTSMCIMRPKCEIKTLVTTDSTDTVCLQSCTSVVVLSIIPVSSERYTTLKTRQVTPRSLLVVFINFVLQMQANTAVVCNPMGALPSECALFLVTLHLFVRHCTAWENQQNRQSFFCMHNRCLVYS